VTWPWWTDLDAYAVMAQCWDHGVRPYRDFAAFNFPGQIYIFWVLGKLFGWGHPSLFYGFDAALLVALGIVLAWWGRRLSGEILPGFIAFAAVSHFYLGLDYTLVGQRDWQGPVLVMLGLLTLQVWPARTGRIVSAGLVAIAVAIRPHVVLFLPAFPLTLDASCRSSGEPWWKTLRPSIEWSLSFTVALVLVFAPLWINGLLSDFLREIRRGGYGRRGTMTTLGNVVRGVRDALLVPSHAALLAALTASLFARSIPWALRRSSLPWLAVFLLALPYRPLHPVPHDYLDLPVGLAWCLALGGLVAMVVASRLAEWARLSAVLVVLAVAVPGPPAYFAPGRSVEAVWCWLEGSPLTKPPLGYQPRASIKTAAHYPWEDYHAIVHFLRDELPPRTQVANVLRWFTALNGPAGRLSPLHGESGLVWAWAVDSEAEARYAKELRRTPDSVVVWIPNEEGPAPLDLTALEAVIRREYEPWRRFGRIEVWRRHAPQGPEGPLPHEE
jgi:hypothetical protein